jgi:hypothetical protein
MFPRLRVRIESINLFKQVVHSCDHAFKPTSAEHIVTQVLLAAAPCESLGMFTPKGTITIDIVSPEDAAFFRCALQDSLHGGAGEFEIEFVPVRNTSSSPA